MRLLTLILLITTLTSCKKYTCQCTVNYKTTSGTFKAAAGEETYTTSKKRAENRCRVFELGKADKDSTAACALL